MCDWNVGVASRLVLVMNEKNKKSHVRGEVEIILDTSSLFNIEETRSFIKFHKFSQKPKKSKKPLAFGKIIMYTKHCCDIDSVEA